MDIIKKLKPHLTVNNAILLVALLITVNLVWGTVGAIHSNFLLQQQVDTLTQQNAYYALQNDTLKFQQAYYNTNEYLELSARTYLDKANPGEKLLILPPNTVSSSPPPAVTASSPVHRSNLEQWLYFLFGPKQ